MPIPYMIMSGLIYSSIANVYLFILMIALNPRIWGVMDYTPEIKAKVKPQTPEEKRLAQIVGTPWLIFVFLFPVLSTVYLKIIMGSSFTIPMAIMNMLVLLILNTFGDWAILDLLVVSKITPTYVVLEGTEKEDYKNYKPHLRAHIKAFTIQTIIIVLFAVIIAIG